MSTRITISTDIEATPKKVWEFWTLPKHIMKWNFASPDWHCPSAENDLRVGGKMKSRMEAKDGSFGFDFEAIYDEVSDHKKIAYTMPDGRTVVSTFEDVAGKTKVTTVFDAENTHPVEFQKNGWLAILNNFKSYVEGN
jgi:uncharacterized protein YndB with AHSA1/START domain